MKADHTKEIGQKIKHSPKKKKLITQLLILLLILFLALIFSRFITTKTKKATESVVPVRTATAIEKPIEITFRVFGNMKAYASVAIKSRVGGPIIKIAIDEGQKVKVNDLLFVIDPRPFAAQLQHAEATLARDQASLEKAQFDFENYSKLVKSGAVSQEQFQGIRSTKSTLEASVKADQADVESAKILLGYTEIRSPIDGIAGTFLTDLGTVVKADETELVVINQIQPIDVNFSVPGTKLNDIKKSIQQGLGIVRVSVPRDKAWIEEGKIVFIDNKIDTTTDTILMKAEFDNKNENLVPGEYVSIDLLLEKIPVAVIIPSEAIQKDIRKNDYVYVVKNNLVERRIITATQISETESWVSQGLAAGEQVITDGIFQVVPGSKVKIQS